MLGFVIGIDPGNDGGIAVLGLDGEVRNTWRMPLLKGKRPTLDLTSLGHVFEWHATPTRLVCVELIRPMGKSNGAVGMAAMMKACGAIWGVCHAMALPYEEVAPQAWQKLVAMPRVTAPTGATEAQKADAYKRRKAEIVNAARRRWPAADLVGSKHAGAKESSGIADSLWIAEFARLRVVGTARTAV